MLKEDRVSICASDARRPAGPDVSRDDAGGHRSSSPLRRKFYETGERIVRAGHVAPGLIVILSGKVEVTQGCGPEQRETIVTHRPGQFAGELAQLSARPSLVDADAREPVQAVVVRSDRLRDLLVQEAELGERIMRAARRMNDDTQRQTLRVDQRMNFAPLHFLARHTRSDRHDRAATGLPTSLGRAALL